MNRINRLLQVINMGFADSRNVRADKLRGKIPAQCEEIFLNTLQDLLSLHILYDRSSQSYLRIEFVNGAVSFHPWVLFSNPSPAVEPCLAPVACSRVSLHQSW